MNNIKNIEDLEKEFSDMKDYSDAQFKTIVDLQKKINLLQEENKSLKSMLEGNLPSLEIPTTDLSLGIRNEQLICETQIYFLKQEAVKRVLTSEEARKLQVFVDVLEKIKKDPKSDDLNVKKLSDDDLIKLVVNNESSTS